MANSDKRLAMLKQVTASGHGDAFAWYGLALEYKAREEHDDALSAFASLRKSFPEYVPQYLICGTLLADLGRANEAREWLESGLTVARERGETHALSELEDALEQLPPPPSRG